MAARGIHVDDANASYAEFALPAAIPASGGSGQNIAMCGWMRIRGDNSSTPPPTVTPSRGQCPFAIQGFTGTIGEFTFRDNTFSNTSPWTIKGYDNDGTTTNEPGTWAPATGEDWFYAMFWDHATQRMTYFAAKDQAVSLTSATAGAANLTTQFDYLRLAGQCFGAYANNIDVTCCRMWAGNGAIPQNATDFLAEMKSATPVNTTQLYAAWPLINATDTSDASGNGRTLTMVGTIVLGDIDPVDIQGGGGGGPATVILGRLQNMENGFGAASAAQLQGVLDT